MKTQTEKTTTEYPNKDGDTWVFVASGVAGSVDVEKTLAGRDLLSERKLATFVEGEGEKTK